MSDVQFDIMISKWQENAVQWRFYIGEWGAFAPQFLALHPFCMMQQNMFHISYVALIEALAENHCALHCN